MVSTTELEEDKVAPLCSDLLRGKYLRIQQPVSQEFRLHNDETYETSSTDGDADIGGRDEGWSESCGDGDRKGSGELHGAER